MRYRGVKIGDVKADMVPAHIAVLRDCFLLIRNLIFKQFDRRTVRHFSIRRLLIFDRASTPRCCCIQSSSDAKGPTSNVTLQPITSTKKARSSLEIRHRYVNMLPTRQFRQPLFPLPLPLRFSPPRQIRRCSLGRELFHARLTVPSIACPNAAISWKARQCCPGMSAMGQTAT
jgi:hypothetical protein